MHKNIGFPDLIKCAFEGFHKLSRQFSYESHSITQKKRHILNHDLSYRCVQGCKELVLSKNVCFGHQVHQCALSDIGIAHKRNPHHRPSVSPLGSHLSVNLLQLFFEPCNLVLNYPSVCLNLSFSRTSHSDSSLLSLQVGPHPRKSRQKILILSQFYLCFCISSLCSLRKNIQNQTCSVQYLYLKFSFYISYLSGRQFIVEYCYVYFISINIGLNFCQFTASYVTSRVRLVYLLYKPSSFLNSRCLSQEFEFIKVFIYGCFIVVLTYHTYEYCLFYVFFNDNRL